MVNLRMSEQIHKFQEYNLLLLLKYLYVWFGRAMGEPLTYVHIFLPKLIYIVKHYSKDHAVYL